MFILSIADSVVCCGVNIKQKAKENWKNWQNSLFLLSKMLMSNWHLRCLFSLSTGSVVSMVLIENKMQKKLEWLSDKKAFSLFLKTHKLGIVVRDTLKSTMCMFCVCLWDSCESKLFYVYRCLLAISCGVMKVLWWCHQSVATRL